jgi:hypothetical protein
LKTKSNNTQNKLRALLAALALVTLIVVPSATAASKKPVTLASIAGTWQATLFSSADCGIGTQILIFTLNSGGAATDVQYIYHTSKCGNGKDNNQTLTITSLNADGSGTAQLDIEGTTLTLNIQVNPSSTVFNIVDATDKGQYHEGTAVKQ